MGKYSIGANKNDYQKLYDRLTEITTLLGVENELDWKKIKRQSDLSVSVLIQYYEKQLRKLQPAE